MQKLRPQFHCHFSGEQGVSPHIVLLTFYRKFDAITDRLAAEGVEGWVAWTGERNQPADIEGFEGN